jgi:carboxypeptidase D
VSPCISSVLLCKCISFCCVSPSGTFIPYIMHHQYSHGNKHNLQGGLIIDGVITDEVTQMDLVVYDYAVDNAETIGLKKSDLAKIKAKSDACGLTGYTDKYLKYPPDGKLPDYNRDGCETWDTFYTLALKRNPTFNVCACSRAFKGRVKYDHHGAIYILISMTCLLF